MRLEAADMIHVECTHGATESSSHFARPVAAFRRRQAPIALGPNYSHSCCCVVSIGGLDREARSLYNLFKHDHPMSGTAPPPSNNGRRGGIFSSGYDRAKADMGLERCSRPILGGLALFRYWNRRRKWHFQWYLQGNQDTQLHFLVNAEPADAC
jgi:hypothetical protein